MNTYDIYIHLPHLPTRFMEHYEQYPAILMWIFQQPRMWWNTISHKSPIGDGQFEIGKNIK